MKAFNYLALLLSLPVWIACSQTNSQNKNKVSQQAHLIGGGCEGCEAVFECPVAFDQLSWIDTLPDFNEHGPKILISGTVYKPDGKTPAKDVVLFIYHTDQKGIYQRKGNEKGWAQRQGYIRGWMKTNEKGQYKFYTLKPASYPHSTIARHIHPVIKEDGKNEYWIDDFTFDDDPFLTPERRKQDEERGGNGIIKLRNEHGILVGERNIYLGKNIPNYQKASASQLSSGLPINPFCLIL